MRAMADMRLGNTIPSFEVGEEMWRDIVAAEKAGLDRLEWRQTQPCSLCERDVAVVSWSKDDSRGIYIIECICETCGRRPTAGYYFYRGDYFPQTLPRHVIDDVMLLLAPVQFASTSACTACGEQAGYMAEPFRAYSHLSTEGLMDRYFVVLRCENQRCGTTFGTEHTFSKPSIRRPLS